MSTVVVDPLGGLELDPPNELRFKGPFDDFVTVSLTIRNPTQKRIAFKIKTTAPKRYCVKPNSGVLDSGHSMKVNVLLQPFTYDPNEKNKHKFMVQYLYLNDDELNMSVADILNMWKDIPTSRLLDLKLKCLFEYSEGEQQQKRLAKMPENETQSLPPQTTTTTNTATLNSDNKSASRQTSSTTSTSKSINSSSMDVYSHATDDSHATDFDSSINSSNNNNNTKNRSLKTSVLNDSNPTANSPTTTSNRKEKDDNTINELKLLKKENESLARENARLKEEETRLRKLVLSNTNRPSSSATNGGGDLTDIFNNRLLIIIIVLIAIIVYLLLFR